MPLGLRRCTSESRGVCLLVRGVHGQQARGTHPTGVLSCYECNIKYNLGCSV